MPFIEDASMPKATFNDACLSPVISNICLYRFHFLVLSSTCLRITSMASEELRLMPSRSISVYIFSISLLTLIRSLLSPITFCNSDWTFFRDSLNLSGSKFKPEKRVSSFTAFVAPSFPSNETYLLYVSIASFIRRTCS